MVVNLAASFHSPCNLAFLAKFNPLEIKIPTQITRNPLFFHKKVTGFFAGLPEPLLIRQVVS